LEQFLEVSNDARFAANDVIFRAGENDAVIYILLKGQVVVVMDAPEHRETVLARIEPRAAFGESSFFGGGPHHATVRCVTPVEAIRLDRAAFARLAAINSPVALRLGMNAAVILAVLLQAADQRISAVIHEEQDVRVKAALRRFHESLTHTYASPSAFIH
jgi:CRP-like cAMP-binding protein